MRFACILSLLIVAILCGAPDAAPAQSLGGGAFIPIQDGSNHDCINVMQSTVLTAQVKRTDTFWKTSKSLGVKVDVKILNQASQAFDFPRGRELSVSDYTGDVGLLPMMFPVMAKYELIDPNDRKAYVNVGLDVYVINIERMSGVANGVLSFIEFSKNLPLPANPYSQGVQLFGDFAQKIVDADIQSSPDKLPAATFAFDLASSASDMTKCEKQSNSSWRYPTLREGIVAVMWDHDGKPEDGFIRVSDVDKYCYYPTQSQRIAFAPKVNNACAPGAPQRALNNPLVAFAIDKWSTDPNAVKATSFRVGGLPGVTVTPALSQSAAVAVVHRKVSDTGQDTTLTGFSEMNPAGVKIYFDAIESDELSKQVEAALKNSGQKAAIIREAETAIALHRCALLGISASNCP